MGEGERGVSEMSMTTDCGVGFGESSFCSVRFWLVGEEGIDSEVKLEKGLLLI